MRERLGLAAPIASALLVACAGALLAACGGSGRHASVGGRPEAAALGLATSPVPARRPAASATPAAPAPPAAGSHQGTDALVTDETENRLLVVQVPSGRVLRRISLPPDPEDVAANAGACSTVVVTSAAAGKVTVLDRETLNSRGTLGGFGTPHIAEIAPGGNYAYVTDDARGTVTAIYLGDARVTGTVEVGTAAHHLSFDPVRPRAWVALGETARTIVVLDTSSLARPRVIGRFDPGFAVHDLSFSPDGSRVWVTSATGPDVAVLDARDHRPLFRVPVGAPPQHVALDGRYAYLTSGYGSSIERADAATGKILDRAASPYGSFELSADGRYVVTSSLERGTLAIYTPQLRLLRVVRLAPAAREVALSPPI